MPTFELRSDMPVAACKLFDWHARPGAFERLAPPWEKIRTVLVEGGIADGARRIMQLRRWPFWLTWEAIHRDCRPGEQFVDEQVRGPFASWVHTHRFVDRGAGLSQLHDHVVCRLPLEPVSRLIAGRRIHRSLSRAFMFRHERTRNDLTRHATTDQRLRFVISGASGLVGMALTEFLTAGGHRVQRLVRREPRAGADEIGWNPDDGSIDSDALDGADAAVHLSGENIAGGRWTAARKESIVRSRIASTALLSSALRGLRRRPRVLITASATGFYGNRGADEVDEDSEAGDGFLASVSKAWEMSSEPAAQAGIRVVNLRIGLVLAQRGGVLASILPLFRCGLGGRLGDGRQFMSWIALDDLLGAIHFAAFNDALRGPVNAVAPNPVTNSEFTKALGGVLRRPTFLPAPGFAIRAALGEMGDALLLGGARVRPTRLLRAGFSFFYPTLEAALRFELGR